MADRQRKPAAGIVLLAVLLAGCVHNAQELTAQNAPRDVATSGHAYVVLDVHRRLGGVFGNTPAYDNVLFVNIAATPNPFYLRTPDDMKLNTVPVNLARIYAIRPGTYGIAFMGTGKDVATFDPATSPVQFTVAAGEVVYLGALTYENFSAGSILDPHRQRITFDVEDELDKHRADIDKNLALLPNAPALKTRLMNARYSELTLDSAAGLRNNPTPPPVPNQPPEQPAPPPPDSNAPWHEAPSP